MLDFLSWKRGWTLFISLLFDHGLEQMCNNLWSEMNCLFHDEIQRNENVTWHTRWDVLQHWEVISLVLWGNSVWRREEPLGEGQKVKEKNHPSRLTNTSHWFSCGWSLLHSFAVCWTGDIVQDTENRELHRRSCVRIASPSDCSPATAQSC